MLGDDWTDSEGNPLGHWEEIDRDAYWALYSEHRDRLRVFSSLTDPEGEYGPRQIYTAWGMPESDAPLIDIRDYKDEKGRTTRQVCRRFVRAASSGEAE